MDLGDFKYMLHKCTWMTNIKAQQAKESIGNLRIVSLYIIVGIHKPLNNYNATYKYTTTSVLLFS